MAAEHTWLNTRGWSGAVSDGAVGGLLGWSMLDLLSRWFGTPHFELSTFVLIGLASTVLGRTVRGPMSFKP